jgi:hypothetical protein
VLVPPDGGVYHAAFPDLGGAEDWVDRKRVHRFERLAGRKLGWVYFSNNWWDGEIRFPRGDVERIARMGRVPFVRLMARSDWNLTPDPNFSTQSIATGSWDTDLHRWCADAATTTARLGTPLLAEFGTEVNGDWFPWNGRWNGGGETTGYGSPEAADGPERFRDAFRHVVDVCRAEGANSITWFFHADLGGSPDAPWNTAAAYYPGDEWVDWIGISNYGLLRRGWSAPDFVERLDRRYGELTSLSPTRPIAVLEYGHAETGDAKRKARWITRATRAVAQGRWPRVAALSYWHEQWENPGGVVSDLHVDSSRPALRAYRRAVARDAFVSKPSFTAR